MFLREIDYKLVESWNNNGTMTFRQKKNWIFQESMSRGSLDDIVTNLNPVAAVRQIFDFSSQNMNYNFEYFTDTCLHVEEPKQAN